MESWILCDVPVRDRCVRPHVLTFLRQGDEWVFRMEMPAIFHKFIVGSRVSRISGSQPAGFGLKTTLT